MPINPVSPTGADGHPGLAYLPGQRAKAAADLEVSKKSMQEIESSLAQAAKALEPFNIALKFSKDDETGRIVVQMIDQKSGETVEQFPNEATLHVAAVLAKLQGQIINRRG